MQTGRDKFKELLKKHSRLVLWTAFAFYCLALIFILFLVPRKAKTATFELYLKYSTNFIPFKTIFGYIRNVLINPRWLKLAVLNIFGNFILFLPMGALLPCLYKKLDRLWKITLAVALMILAAESTQMLLLIGIFDVDDFILNLPGAMLGYGLLKLEPVNKILHELGFIKQ